jgi:hypothetical protein
MHEVTADDSLVKLRGCDSRVHTLNHLLRDNNRIHMLVLKGGEEEKEG